MKKIVAFTYAFLATLLVSAQGYYVEFKMSSAGKEAALNGTMKTYSQDGNSRSEINMVVPQMPGGGMKITSLTLKAEPSKIYLINEKDKTYSEMETGSQEDYKDLPQADYEITVVGKETVNGYNTTHSIVKINGKLREELWTTKDINGYADFSKIKTKYTGKDNMFKALGAKGADGMPVRIKAEDRGQGMQMDLVKAEKRENPSSMFTLNVYTKGGAFSGIPGGEGMQEMMKKLQNMTPQEREEMLKHMQDLYSKQPH